MFAEFGMEEHEKNAAMRNGRMKKQRKWQCGAGFWGTISIKLLSGIKIIGAFKL